ncbi:MAG: hypothetical protein O7F73_07125 [Gammaproteobacteria bacterium]|nr:hypothetical protein [Gammaproteobacteria bacterium]
MPVTASHEDLGFFGEHGCRVAPVLFGPQRKQGTATAGDFFPLLP